MNIKECSDRIRRSHLYALSPAIASFRPSWLVGVGLLHACFTAAPLTPFAQETTTQAAPTAMAAATQADLDAFDRLEAELNALQAETTAPLETSLAPTPVAAETPVATPSATVNVTEEALPPADITPLEDTAETTPIPEVPADAPETATKANKAPETLAEDVTELNTLIESAFLESPAEIASLDTSSLTTEAAATTPVSATMPISATTPDNAEETDAPETPAATPPQEKTIPVEDLLPAEEPLAQDDLVLQTLPILRAIAKAIDYSREVAISSEKVRQAAYDVNKSKSAYYPTLDFNFSFGKDYKSPGTGRSKYHALGQAVYMNASDINLSFSQMLFDGFRTEADVDEKQIFLLSAYHGANVIRHKTAKSVIDTLIDIRSQLNKISAVHAYVTELNKFSKKMNAAAEEGGVSDTLKKYVDSRVAFAEQSKIQAETALQDALENYAFLTGDDDVTVEKLNSIQLPELSPVQPYTHYKETLLKFNPELLQKRADWLASKSTVKKLKGELYPSVHLKGAWGETNDVGGYVGRVSTGSVMMELSYNIFDGGKSKAKRDSARSQTQEHKMQITRTARDLSRKLKSAWQELKAKQEEYNLVQQEMASSQQVKELRTQEFREGGGELLSVVEAVEDLQSATMRKLNIEEELERQRFALEFLSGRPELIAMPNISPNSPNDPVFVPEDPSLQGQRIAQAAEIHDGVDPTPLAYNLREQNAAKDDIDPYRTPEFKTQGEKEEEARIAAKEKAENEQNSITGFPEDVETDIGNGMAQIPTETFVTAFGQRIRTRKSAETLEAVPEPTVKTADLQSLMLPNLAVANVNPRLKPAPLKRKSYTSADRYSLEDAGVVEAPTLDYVPPQDLVPHTLAQGVTPPQSYSSVFNQHPELYQAQQGMLANNTPAQQGAPAAMSVGNPATLAGVPTPQVQQATATPEQGLNMQADWTMPQVPFPHPVPYVQNTLAGQQQKPFADMPSRQERLKQEPMTIQFDGPENTRKFLVPLQKRPQVETAKEIQPLVQAPTTTMTQDDFPAPAAGPVLAVPAVHKASDPRPNSLSIRLSDPLEKHNRMVVPLF